MLARSAPVPLIIDTDMGFDVDDVGAVCAAHALEQSGEARILAIVHDTGYAKGIGAVSAINHFYGRDDIELGAWKGQFGKYGDQNQNKYVSDLINYYAGPVTHYDQVPHCAETYRKVLAAQPDNSVKIASIGMTTCLSDLMSSSADKYSNLDGPALVGKKVKEIVWMDGMYNFGCAEALNSAWLGPDEDCHGSAANAVNNVPSNVKQIFSGVGGNIISGGRLSTCAGDENPCRKAFMNWAGYGNGRSSWDPLATVMAVRGAANTKLRETDSSGDMSVDGEGREYWNSGDKPQTHVATAASDGDIVRMLDDLYCQPVGPTPGPSPSPSPSPGHYYPDVDGMVGVGTTADSGAGPAMTGYGGGDYKAAWDGNVNTFYDYSNSDGGYTQAKMANPAVIGHIEFYPRSGFLERHIGGKFIGITTSGEQVTLASIGSTPAGGWNGLRVTSSQQFIVVRYESPSDGYGNIAEVKLYTAASPSHNYPDVDGMVGIDTTADSGAGPAMSGFGGGDYKAAWDGDVETFYDYSESDGGYSKATLSTPAVVGHIEFYPRSGFPERHIGGKFVGITGSGEQVTLVSISSSPQSGWNSLSVSSSQKLSAVKYVSPAGGYGNIAEIKVYAPSSVLI